MQRINLTGERLQNFRAFHIHLSHCVSRLNKVMVAPSRPRHAIDQMFSTNHDVLSLPMNEAPTAIGLIVFIKANAILLRDRINSANVSSNMGAYVDVTNPMIV